MNAFCRTPTEPSFQSLSSGAPSVARRWRLLRLAFVLAAGVAAYDSALAQKIVFVSDRDGNDEIYVMNADGSGQTNLTNHQATDIEPQWSPDGSQILFRSDRVGNWDIYVMNADGSGEIQLTNDPAPDIGAQWSPDGAKILFFSDRSGSQGYVMNSDGSDEIQITDVDGYVYQANWSPDGSRVVYFAGANQCPQSCDQKAYIVTADGAVTSEVSVNIPPTASLPTWSPDGKKILVESGDPYGSYGSLVVAATDGSVLDRYLVGQVCCGSNPTWSPDGFKILFVEYYDFSLGELNVVPIHGAGKSTLAGVESPAQLQWSPDGEKVLYNSWNGNYEVHVVNVDGGSAMNLSTSPAEDVNPFWSPDGSRIFFTSDRDGHDELYVVKPDGSGLQNLTNSLASNSSFQAFGDFSVDPTPVISDGGIVVANLLPAIHAISPLSIVSVFGTGFSAGSVYYPTLDEGGKITAILGGSCVEINGERAPMFAILPNQANVQAPSDLPLGPVTVTVIRNCDTTEEVRSNAVMVTVEQVSPAFFLFAPYAADGNIAARFSDGFAAVAPNGAIVDQQGVSRPARPGEAISLFGTGWGQTETPLATGQVATDANSLASGSGLTVTFDGVPLDADEGIEYFGIAPGAAGVYQLAIRVPDNALPGNHQVVLTLYGRSTPAAPIIPTAAPSFDQ